MSDLRGKLKKFQPDFSLRKIWRIPCSWLVYSLRKPNPERASILKQVQHMLNVAALACCTEGSSFKTYACFHHQFEGDL